MTKPITSAELDAIQARADAASPGAWRDVCMGSEGYLVMPAEGKTVRERGRKIAEVMSRSFEECKADAAFISAARTDVPRLVTALKIARNHLKLATKANTISAELNEELRAELARQAEAHRGEVAALTEELGKVKAALNDREAEIARARDALSDYARRTTEGFPLEDGIDAQRRSHVAEAEGLTEALNDAREQRDRYRAALATTDAPADLLRALDGGE